MSVNGSEAPRRRAKPTMARYSEWRFRLVETRSRPSDRYGTDLLPPMRGVDAALMPLGSRQPSVSCVSGKGLPERGGEAVAQSDRTALATVNQRSRILLVTLACSLAIFGASCSSDDAATTTTTTTEAPSSSTTETTTDTSSSTETPTPSTSTTSSTPSGQSIEDEIVARYIAYWDARFAANTGTPNPDDPALREYATGAQLDAVVAETRANLEQGRAFRPADDPADIQWVNVIEVEGDHAVVQECVVTDGVIFNRDTGEVIDGEVYTQNVRGELQRVDGAWKVSAARLIQQWEGVAGCAHASE